MDKPNTYMPALFLGHGSPMAAFEDNKFTRYWANVGRALPTPRAIVCISAHWYTQGTYVTASKQPQTIHDFHGFPEQLYQFTYPAIGDPRLAERIIELLQPLHVIADPQRGLDHGSWSVLKHLFPKAQIPVLQLSIDRTKPPVWHYELGRQLRVLRDEGVLLVGSGNVVHNLRQVRFEEQAVAFPWAIAFNRTVRAAIEQRDHNTVIDYVKQGEAAALSVPTPDHYLPLLYVLGASDVTDAIHIDVDDVVLSSISMMSVQFG